MDRGRSVGYRIWVLPQRTAATCLESHLDVIGIDII